MLHFIGHGDYDTRTDEGVLALVDAGGRADLVEAGRLADLLGEAQPTPRLVVLNSCSSGQSGASDLFSGTAAALARSGISAVAAMQFAISDTAAIAFARGFYTAIAQGRGIDEAARSGRISILGAPRSLEWVTPVLYLRGQATQLFTLTAQPAAARETPRGHLPIPPDQPPDAAQPTDTGPGQGPRPGSRSAFCREPSGPCRRGHRTLGRRRAGRLAGSASGSCPTQVSGDRINSADGECSPDRLRLGHARAYRLYCFRSDRD